MDLRAGFSKFDFMKSSRIWISISLFIILVGIASLIFQGLNLAVDYTGGVQMDLVFPQAVTKAQIDSAMAAIGQSKANVKGIGTSGKEYLVTVPPMTDTQLAQVTDQMHEKLGDFTQGSVDEVSPTVARELVREAIIGLLLASIGILIYVTLRFEWRFGVGVIVALIHDVLIVLAFFSVFRWRVDSTFMAAMLTIAGYSINDTIVVFDRLRENLKARKKESFAEIANVSIGQTLMRSINTSGTTLVAVLAVLFLAGRPTWEFAMAMFIGIASGTYSSIFIAAPVWVWLRNWSEKRQAATAMAAATAGGPAVAVPAGPAGKVSVHRLPAGVRKPLTPAPRPTAASDAGTATREAAAGTQGAAAEGRQGKGKKKSKNAPGKSRK